MSSRLRIWIIARLWNYDISICDTGVFIEHEWEQCSDMNMGIWGGGDDDDTKWDCVMMTAQKGNAGAIMTSLRDSGVMTRIWNTGVMTDKYGTLVKVKQALNRDGQALSASGV